MCCSGTVYTTEACAAPGRIYTLGCELHWNCLHCIGLCCTRKCLHTGIWAALELSTLQKPVLHPDVSTHWGMSCTGTVYTTEACAAPGRVYTLGVELHWICLRQRGLCCTRTCLHIGPWAALELSTLQRSVLHPDEFTHWDMCCTGNVYTTQFCAAPGRVYTLGYELHWNCLYYRGLCCIQTCQYTGIWVALELYILQRPVLHPDVSKHWGMSCTGTVYTTEACAAPGRFCTLGYELHRKCLHYICLCCTQTCLHTGVWAAQELSTIRRPVPF
jgi:hypothetical protein